MSTTFMEGFGRGHQQYFTTVYPQYTKVIHKDQISSVNSNFIQPEFSNYCLLIRQYSSAQTILWTKDIYGDFVKEFYVKYRFQTDEYYLNSTLFTAACNDDYLGTIEIQDNQGYFFLYNIINTTNFVKHPTNIALLPFKWYLVELWVRYPDGACTSETGAYELRIDGIVEAKSDNAWVCSGTYGNYVDRFIWRHGYNTNQLITDVVFDTTAAFDVHTSDTSVHWFYPSSNGTNSDWSPSVGSSYECTSVNGPVATADEKYILSNQIGDKESYSLSTDSTGSLALVNSIQTEHRVVREGRSNVTHVNPYLRINGSEYSGTELPQNRAFVCQAKPIRTNWDNNPDTSLEWTESDILGLELGIESEA